MSLESRLASIARNIFYPEFSFAANCFKSQDGQEYELADHIIWIDDLLIGFQLKERQQGLQDSSAWFEKKVLKRATKQVRDTIAFLQNHQTILIENQRGHRVHLTSAAVKQRQMVVVYDEPRSSIYRARPNRHISKTAGLIHLLNVADFFEVCRTLITPIEISTYLNFRDTIVRANEFLSERAILGQFLAGATNELPTEHNAEVLARFHNNRSRFDVRWVFRHLPKVIHTTRLGDDRSYYEILKEYALMDRLALEQCRVRIGAINAMLIDERLNEGPRRLISPRGTCLVWMAIHRQLFEKRLTILHNLTGLAKYDSHVNRCVGMAFSQRSDGNIELDLCYMEGDWVHDEGVERLLSEHNPFTRFTTAERLVYRLGR